MTASRSVAPSAASVAAVEVSPEPALLPPEPYSPPPPNSTLRVQPHILNPYDRQQEYPLPWLGRLLLFLVDLILVPLRILLIILLLMSLSFVCRILIIGARAAERAGEPGFGRVRTWMIRHAVFGFGVPICWCFGFVTSILKHQQAKTRSGILIGNHMGYCEIMLLVTHYAPSVVAKKDIASYPLVGTIARALQCIFIDRKEPNDRHRVMEMMLERGRNQENGKFPPLLIFPEGTTNNGATMLKFQKGIFTVGLPVQPIVIKSHFIYYNAGWVNGSMLEHVLLLLTRLYHPLSMRELPLYTPSQAEIADPILYADNACQTMANALLVPVSTLTMYENPEFHGQFKHRHRPSNAADANTTQPQPSFGVAAPAPAASVPESNISISVVQPGEKYASGCEPLATQPLSARKQGWIDQQSIPSSPPPSTPAIQLIVESPAPQQSLSSFPATPASPPAFAHSDFAANEEGQRQLIPSDGSSSSPPVSPFAPMNTAHTSSPMIAASA